MGFKIKNSLTGEFEKLPILTLKGEKGETGGVEEYNKVDYMGNKYETLKQANDANVEYAVKTAIGEFNYLDYDGQHITATDTIEGRSKSAILKGNTGYRDIDTGEFLETFEEGRNLELVSVKMPVLTTTGKNLFDTRSLTFSKIRYFGLFASIAFRHSQRSDDLVPLFSCPPLISPARLKSWQGDE